MPRSKAEGDGRSDCAVTGDRNVTEPGRRHFDSDATAWLVGEAVARVHADDGEGQGGFKRAVELLGRLEATGAFGALLKAVPREDVPLRWSLLYVLAEVGDMRAAELFARVAGEPIRGERDPAACESEYDGEVLVRTMAIEGLARLAARDRALVDLLHNVLETQPEPALRIEAVKAILAAAPDEAKRLKKTLPEDLQFALTLKRVRAQTLAVEYEATGVDAVRPMPSLDRTSLSPTTRTHDCC